MPSAPKLEAPQGQPLFDVQFRAISESLAGNGVLANGDLEVTDGTNALEIDVASGTLYYVATEYTYGGASPAATLSGGDGTYDRWDTIAFDTGTSSVVVHEGTPAQYPEPPDISGGEVLLAIVYVASGATDIGSSDILNWRAKFSNESEEVHYDDSTGVYGVDNVDAALDELQEAAQATVYPFALDTDTDMDLGSTDLTAGDGATVLYESANGWFRNEILQFTANLTADEQLSGHPFGTADLDLSMAPTWTGTHTFDNQLVGQEIATPSSPAAGYSALYFKTDGFLYRQDENGVERRVHSQNATSSQSANYTTSGEDVIFVDSSGGSVTITLASADTYDGSSITVIDQGGSATSNAITINTESTETIDGGSSKEIASDYGAVAIESNGSNWFTSGSSGGLTIEEDGTVVTAGATAISAGEGIIATDDGDGTATLDYAYDQAFNGEAGAAGLASGNQLLIERTSLADGESLNIYQCSLTLSAAQASSTGMDLELVTFDGAGGFTSQVTLIAGDGATVYDEVTGDPVGSYTNTSGGAQTVGVIADNETGGSEDVHGSAEGVIV